MYETTEQRRNRKTVRLCVDLPERSLHKGRVGEVLSRWFSPQVVYEVEFESPDEPFPTRVLLSARQVESLHPEGQPPLDDPSALTEDPPRYNVSWD